MQHELAVILIGLFSVKQFHDANKDQWTECKKEFGKCKKIQDEGPTYVAKCKTSETEVRQKLKVCLIKSITILNTSSSDNLIVNQNIFLQNLIEVTDALIKAKYKVDKVMSDSAKYLTNREANDSQKGLTLKTCSEFSSLADQVNLIKLSK